MRHFSLYITGLIACAFLSSCDSDKKNEQPISIQLNFAPNAQYHYVKTAKEVLEPEGKKQAFVINQEKTIESDYEVITDGNHKTVNFSFVRIAIKAGRDNVNALEYDSQNTLAQNKEIFNSVTALLHRPYSAILDNKGNVTNIQKPTTGSITNNTGSLNNNAQLGFSDQSLNAMIEELFDFYPDTKVKPGDSWKKTANATIGFTNVTAENNYKLISVENGMAHIEINNTLTTLPADSTDVKMKGVQIGVMLVNIKSGLITDCNINSHMNGQMKLGINQQVSLSSETHITGKQLYRKENIKH